MLDKFKDLFLSSSDDSQVPLKFPYKITEEPNKTDSPYRAIQASPYLIKLLEDLGEEAHYPDKRTIERIQKAINQFPNQPQFYNYLATAYKVLNRDAKAQEINKKAIQKFPEYLFARVALAHEAIEDEEYEKVPDYLGANLTLEGLYPERTIFHTTEVINYYLVAGMYHADRLEFEKAEKALKIVESVDRDSPQAELLAMKILAQRMEQGQKNMDYMNRNEIIIEDRDFHYENQTDTPPAFYHAEIEWLYQYDTGISRDKVNALLALPRPTLVEDLERVLEDGIRRFEYWSNLEWENHTHSFLTHAIILLGELRATEALPAILNQLRQGYEYNEYWFTDWSDDIFQTPLYHLGRENLEVIKAFVLEPNIEAFYKNQASNAVPLVAVLEPERRTEIQQWYQDVIRYLLAHTDNEELLDTTFLAFLISDILDISALELKPLAKEVYDKELATYSILGEWKDVEEEFDTSTRDSKDVLNWYYENGFKQYDKLEEMWKNIEKREREAAEKAEKEQKLKALERATSKSLASDTPIHVEKIGRNERVSVKYKDGTIKKDVKYKTVEQDVESGKATLI